MPSSKKSVMYVPAARGRVCKRARVGVRRVPWRRSNAFSILRIVCLSVTAKFGSRKAASRHCAPAMWQRLPSVPLLRRAPTTNTATTIYLTQRCAAASINSHHPQWLLGWSVGRPLLGSASMPTVPPPDTVGATAVVGNERRLRRRETDMQADIYRRR